MESSEKDTTPDSLPTFAAWLEDDDKLRELGRHRLARAIRAAFEERLDLPATDPHVTYSEGAVEPTKHWINLEIWNQKSDAPGEPSQPMSDEELGKRVADILTPEERATVERLGGPGAIEGLDF